MILDQKFIIKLSEEARFLDGIMLLDNDDVIVLATTSNSSKFQHYDKQNKLLRQYKYQQQIYGFKYIDKDEALFMMTQKKKKIGIINFKTKQQKFFDFPFKDPSIFKNKLIVFPQSGRYVIYQHPDYSTKNGKFTFFNYPHQNYWQIQIQDTLTYQIKAINLTSSLTFYKGRAQSSIQFYIINSDTKQLKKYSAPKPGNADYVIKSIYQLNPGQLFLFCDCSISQYKNLVFNCKVHDQKIQNVNIIRKFKLDLPQKIYQVLISGEYIYFLQFDIDPVKQQQIYAPIIGVSRQTEQKVFESKCLITHNYNYQISTEGDNKLLLFINSYQNCKQIQIRIQKIVKQKQLYLYMLTKIGNFNVNMLESIIQAFDYD